MIIRRQRRWGRVRRAAIEINVDAIRMLVADVNALSRVLLREVYSREVAQGKGSLENVVRSLSAEARDLGAAQLAIVARSALWLSASLVSARWSATDEALAAWRCARAHCTDDGVVVGCVRTRRPRPDDDGSPDKWSLSRSPPPVWQLCAADAAGQRTFATSVDADGKLLHSPPPWLETSSSAVVVGDEVSLARCLDAIQGQLFIEADSLRKKLTTTLLRRQQTGAVAAAQLQLLVALSDATNISQFTYVRSFGLCAGALLHNDLFSENPP